MTEPPETPRETSPVEGAGLPPAARDELEALFEGVDRAVAETGAVCQARGVCCDFTRSEHTLWATWVEVAWVLETHAERWKPDDPLCPFWQGGLCTERERRPLGCRTYFCDPRSRDELERIHETFHERLRDLADRHGLPYRYIPFVRAVRGALPGPFLAANAEPPAANAEPPAANAEPLGTEDAAGPGARER